MQTRQGTSALGRSTRPDDVSLEELRRARGYRRAGIGALALFVLAGLFNLLGVRTGIVSAAAAGYQLSVEYEAVTRPGLASEWIVVVRREGGFDGPVMPVNPKHRAIEGVLTYPDVASLPLIPDLAVIGTPPDEIPSTYDFSAPATSSFETCHVCSRSQISCQRASIVRGS